MLNMYDFSLFVEGTARHVYYSYKFENVYSILTTTILQQR